VFVLKAFGPGGALVTAPWLSNITHTWGDDGTGKNPTAKTMPTWAFDAAAGTYRIDGTGVQSWPNPTVGIAMLALADILTLEVCARAARRGRARRVQARARSRPAARRAALHGARQHGSVRVALLTVRNEGAVGASWLLDKLPRNLN
jgi:hypothetical protein